MSKTSKKHSILIDDFEFMIKEILSIILKDKVPEVSVDILSYEEAKSIFNISFDSSRFHKKVFKGNKYYFVLFSKSENSEVITVKLPWSNYKLYSFDSDKIISFVDFSIEKILDMFTSKEEPVNIIFRDRDEIIRLISKYYLKYVFKWLYKGNKISDDIFLVLTILSNQTYEGIKSESYLVFTDKDIKDFEILFTNSTLLSVRNIRIIKKMVQISSKRSLCLVVFENNIVGLTSFQSINSRNVLISLNSDFWEISVYSPDLSIDKDFFTQIEGKNFLPLVRFRNGLPEVPKVKIDLDTVKKSIKGTFPGISSTSMKKILKIFLEIPRINHGLIIVITTKELALSETKRLLYRSFQVNPFSLFDDKLNLKFDLLNSITSIDGAIIVDTDGMCYGIGVILDGDVSLAETPSRGARYNSCVRYIETRNNRSIAIVASDDSMIDVISFESIQKKKLSEFIDSLMSENIIVL